MVDSFRRRLTVRWVVAQPSYCAGPEIRRARSGVVEGIVDLINEAWKVSLVKKSSKSSRRPSSRIHGFNLESFMKLSRIAMVRKGPEPEELAGHLRAVCAGERKASCAPRKEL